MTILLLARFKINIYERLVGPISDWKTSYLTVDNNILLRSPDFIFITKFVLKVFEPNEQLKFMSNFEIYDVPIIDHSGLVLFVIPDNDKNMQLRAFFKKAKIKVDTYRTGTKHGTLNIFGIYGKLVYYTDDPTKQYWTYIKY